MTFKNKLQPLIYPSYVADVPSLTKDSCSGRTTAFAMAAISAAMLSPETPVDLSKYKELDAGSPVQNGMMTAAGGFLDTVNDVISALNLKFLNVDKVRRTLTYNIY